MINVFIIDDSFYVRDAWKNIIARDPRTRLCGSAEQVDEALGTLEILLPKPDVILLDIRFRERNQPEEYPKGLGAIGQLLDLLPDTRILCVSDVINPHTIIQAIRAGANGYLDKNSVRERLIEAVVLVANDAFVVSQNIAEVIIGVVAEVQMGNPVVLTEDNGINDLPERRREVAELTFRYGLSAKQVAENLNISHATVQQHIKLIRQDLGVTDYDQIIRLITGGTVNEDDN